MQNRPTLPSDFQIRSPETPAEIDMFLSLNAKVFRPDEDPNLVAILRGRYLLNDPDIHLHRLRGAFSGDTCLGGYTLLERTLCMGAARIRAGCVNGVMTHPEYRHRGISSILMQEAVHIAKSQRHGLLFLHGIGNFYHQFGYTDALEDMPRHVFARKYLPELPAEGCTVRAATVEDAPPLLACYQRHYSHYLASFAPERTLQRQEHHLRNWPERAEDARPLVALDAEGKLQGYLMLSRKRGKLHAYEVATESWSATLALLHAHARLLDAEPEPPQEIDWPIPPTDSTFYLLAEHLPIQSQSSAFPNGGWLARPGHLPTLLGSLLPLWRERWQRRSRQVNWSGTFGLTIDEHTSFLAVTSTDISLVDGSPTSSIEHYITFSGPHFTQLIFSFRPLAWLLSQQEQRASDELGPVLEALFPAGEAWVAGSDSF